MKSRTLLASVLATLTLAAAAQAATLAPVKGYAKPDEPILIQFLNENEQGKKALDKIGLAATQLDGLFTPATLAEISEGNKPNFQLYTFEGQKIGPKAAEVLAKPNGIVDISLNFPELKKTGTYILVWKNATPIVIETLPRPIPWALIMDEAHVPADKRADALKQVTSDDPVVTHLVPLQYVLISTDHGDIKAKFSYDRAPHTVDNFVALTNQKFYDGSAFHRIISGFMIQGGDSLANSESKAGTGGPGYNVGAEFSTKSHERGTLSMARSGIDAAGSQFFIVHQKAAHLDGLYTAFGDVVDGLKVVDEIAATPAEKGSGAVTGAKPQITSIRALPATAEMYLKPTP